MVNIQTVIETVRNVMMDFEDFGDVADPNFDLYKRYSEHIMRASKLYQNELARRYRAALQQSGGIRGRKTTRSNRRRSTSARRRRH